MDLRTSLDTELRKISTPPTPGIEPGPRRVCNYVDKRSNVVKLVFSFLPPFFFFYLSSPSVRLTHPGNYNPNARGPMLVVDQYTRRIHKDRLPENVISTISA